MVQFRTNSQFEKRDMKAKTRKTRFDGVKTKKENKKMTVQLNGFQKYIRSTDNIVTLPIAAKLPEFNYTKAELIQKARAFKRLVDTEKKNQNTKHSLLHLLTYKRPEGGLHQDKFCNRFLKPVFGDPDQSGNYSHIIFTPDNKFPKVIFTAHHDTVHRKSGRQEVMYNNEGYIITNSGECLGADCTTGIYLILRMIEANIPGMYVIHASEETGCVGSKDFVRENQDFLEGFAACISFDRRGTTNIITHQLGMRTCSEKFAHSISGILGPTFAPDNTGAYTDSNEYTDVVAECTNLSVGYYQQHTAKEYQDEWFAHYLAKQLINADWSKLIIARDPSDIESLYGGWPTALGTNSPQIGNSFDKWVDEQEAAEYMDAESDMLRIIKKYPEELKEILQSYGYNAMGLLDDVEDIALKRGRKIGRLH